VIPAAGCGGRDLTVLVFARQRGRTRESPHVLVFRVINEAARNLDSRRGCDESLSPARLPVSRTPWVAPSRGVTTHLRAVRELFTAQRSSRWLNRNEVAKLFACASFGRLNSGRSRLTLHRCSVVRPGPRAPCMRSWGLRDAPCGTSRIVDPSRSERIGAGGAFTGNRAVLWHPQSRTRHRLAGSSRTAACAPSIARSRGARLACFTWLA